MHVYILLPPALRSFSNLIIHDESIVHICDTLCQVFVQCLSIIYQIYERKKEKNTVLYYTTNPFPLAYFGQPEGINELFVSHSLFSSKPGKAMQKRRCLFYASKYLIGRVIRMVLSLYWS